MMVERRAREFLMVLAAVAACSAHLRAHAGGLNAVSAAAEQWLVAQADSQKRVDKLADERQGLADDYRNTLRESDSLKLYIQQLKAQLGSQQQEMDSIRGEIREISRTNVEILPLMQEMLATLGQFVELDVPFLQEERRERVKKLVEMMPRADVTVSEKFRRIVEAYQIEIDYGRTIESYTGNLSGKQVDFLRVGRVGLLYQTPDGKETGYWDRDKKGWVQDDSYGDGVREGLKVARKQTSPDLLIVPIQAAAK
jgi:chromosome segregation ATPase